MHLRCYQERADVGAVVHAHPPTATGFAVAHLDMDRYNMIETVLTLGSVPVTPYGTPSTYEVPEAIAPYLQEHDALLLMNHGALTVAAISSPPTTAWKRLSSTQKSAWSHTCSAASGRFPMRISTGSALCEKAMASRANTRALSITAKRNDDKR